MKILSEKGRKYFGKYAKWVDWIILIGIVFVAGYYISSWIAFF